MLHLLLHRFDLSEPLDITLSAVEPGAQECAHEVERELRADHLGAEAEDVHVVVLDALVRGVRVVADRGADPGDLAGRDGGADPRAADEDAAFGVPADHRVAELARLVRVVDPLCIRVRTEVDGLVPERVQLLQHPLAQLDAAMVERDGDPHATRSSSAAARAATFSGVKPRFRSTSSPGAEAPKRSIATDAPASPIHRSQPCEIPASTESRARTS